MINHQSPYGQIIKIPSSSYYEMSDDDIKEMEEKYANSNKSVINFSSSFEPDDEYIADIILPFIDFGNFEE